VWLKIETLRSAGSVISHHPDWPARFDAMIGYAYQQGWLSANGDFLAAHIESAS
jgi:hypothetical protein